MSRAYAAKLKDSVPRRAITSNIMGDNATGVLYSAFRIRPGTKQVAVVGGTAPNTVLSLTSRQREVLQLLAEGRSAKEIAAILNISMETVEYHKYRMMDDLGIKTAAELTRYPVKQGFVEP